MGLGGVDITTWFLCVHTTYFLLRVHLEISLPYSWMVFWADSRDFVLLLGINS